MITKLKDVFEKAVNSDLVGSMVGFFRPWQGTEKVVSFEAGAVMMAAVGGAIIGGAMGADAPIMAKAAFGLLSLPFMAVAGVQTVCAVRQARIEAEELRGPQLSLF